MLHEFNYIFFIMGPYTEFSCIHVFLFIFFWRKGHICLLSKFLISLKHISIHLATFMKDMTYRKTTKILFQYVSKIIECCVRVCFGPEERSVFENTFNSYSYFFIHINNWSRIYGCSCSCIEKQNIHLHYGVKVFRINSDISLYSLCHMERYQHRIQTQLCLCNKYTTKAAVVQKPAMVLWHYYMDDVITGKDWIEEMYKLGVQLISARPKSSLPAEFKTMRLW